MSTRLGLSNASKATNSKSLLLFNLALKWRAIRNLAVENSLVWYFSGLKFSACGSVPGVYRGKVFTCVTPIDDLTCILEKPLEHKSHALKLNLFSPVEMNSIFVEELWFSKQIMSWQKLPIYSSTNLCWVDVCFFYRGINTHILLWWRDWEH